MGRVGWVWGPGVGELFIDATPSLCACIYTSVQTPPPVYINVNLPTRLKDRVLGLGRAGLGGRGPQGVVVGLVDGVEVLDELVPGLCRGVG